MNFSPPMRSFPLRLFAALASLVAAVSAKQVDAPVKLGRGGHLEYTADAQGNRVIDFSSAGYRGGGVLLPAVAARVRVAPGADDGARIQAALDFVAAQPPDENGFRGAVQLEAGTFHIADRLRLVASGVVLRGAGTAEGGTLLIASGTDRRALIEIGRRASDREAPPVPVTDPYVPVGATRLTLRDASNFKVGATIVIERPSPAAWIALLGMNDAPGRQPFEWKLGTMNVRWTRTVTAITGNTLTLDAPLTVALEAQWGGGTVRAVTSPGRVENVGVENLRCEAACDPASPLDEDHAWTAVHVEAARDVWIADVTARHFAGSLAYVSAAASRVTVQDCVSLEPVSENGGFRRMTFHTAGQQTLFLRCRAEHGRNAFSTGHLAAGPNVFLECVAMDPLSFSGAAGSWGSGILFDNVRVDGGELRLDNLETWNQGVGWAAANSLLWQCTASTIICRSPPGATNWAIGPWAQFVGDGRWSDVNEFVRPDSLYVAQLADRAGPTATRALERRRYLTVAPGVPRLEAVMPDLAARLAPNPRPAGHPLALQNGWLLAGDRLLIGAQASMTYWRGSTLPARAPEIGFSLTRFVPDRIGTGLTDDLEDVANAMVAEQQVAVRQHRGLWYDRRRDDHEMIRRPDGDVWPPFYEQPWTRSGQGVASNGLSRYDLARFNPWYFSRLRAFAGLAHERGLVLLNEMFFQHNILEAGAHWAEFPWRSANNVNAVGFPEPPPYVESDGSAPSRPEYGKRIFMAPLFYDVSHPVRRELLRAYIRQCLANLADEPNVVHLIGEEFSGPLPFMQFWVDTVAEWQRETGRHPLIGLSAPKDVQDAILADPGRSRVIDVIDLKYWWRTDTGLFAPKGGENLSPRQHERLWKGGPPTAASIAGMVGEYRRKFPEKAVIVAFDRADGWAVASAGGSLPRLPATTDANLLAALTRMRPAESANGVALLTEPGANAFAYAAKGGDVSLKLGAAAGSFVLYRVDLKTGRLGAPEKVTTSADGAAAIALPAGAPAAVWVTREK
jgi:hypothetical protein